MKVQIFAIAQIDQHLLVIFYFQITSPRMEFSFTEILDLYYNNQVLRNEEGKLQESIQLVPQLTQDTVWESDNTQENITYKIAKRSKVKLSKLRLSYAPVTDHRLTHGT